MSLTSEQVTYNQSAAINWEVFFASLSSDQITRMHGALNGTGINGENSYWENSSYKENTGVFKTYDDLYNQFTEHLAYGDLSELIVAIKTQLDANGEVFINGKKLDISSFNTPGTTDISDFFSTPADQFDPLQYKFETPQSIALLHFSRNLLLEDQDISYLELIKNADQFTRVEDDKNEFHKLDNSDLGISGNAHNIKWISKNGLSEYIFKSDFSNVDDVVNAGSYNFFAPTTDLDGYNHLQLDVFTWIAFGNFYGDTTTVFDRGYDGVKSDLPAQLNVIIENIGLSINNNITLGDGDDVVPFIWGVRFDLNGGAGNDYFNSGEQNDTFNGGEGTDTVAYTFSTSGISVNLRLGQGYDGYAAYDNNFEQLISIENIVGSNYTDIIVGSIEDNKLEGLAGNDFIVGEGGNDTLDGGAGDDYLEGGRGNDVLIGGEGSDTAIYSGNYTQYSITANIDGSISVVSGNIDELGTDTLEGIERIEFTDGFIVSVETVGSSLTPIGSENTYNGVGSSGPVQHVNLIDGTSAIYWRTFDGHEIQFLDSDGVSSHRISVPKPNAYTPEGAVLENGNFVQIYTTSDEVISGSYNLTGQIYSSSGQLVGSSFVVNSPESGDRWAYAITEAPNGGFAVAWHDVGFGAGSIADSIRVQSFDNNGQKVGPQVLIDEPAFSPEIEVYQDGSYLVSWYSYNESSDVFQYFSDSGIPQWSSPIHFVGDPPFGEGTTFSSVLLDDGSIAITFPVQNTIGVHLISPNGELQMVAENFLPTSVTLLSDGRFLAVGEGDDGDGGGIVANIYDAQGNSEFEQPIVINSNIVGYQNSATSYMSGNEEITIFWRDDNDSLRSQVLSTTSGEVNYSVSREISDDNGVHIWESYTDTFDADGILTSRSMTYDDGRQAETTYTNGIRTSRTITDTSDVFTWSTIEQNFDANGIRILQVNNYDDGRNLVTGYTNGLRSSSNMSDEDDTHIWESYTDTFNADGILTSRSMTYDDGRQAETTYTNDIRTSRTITDTSDVFTWSTIEQNFDANGTRILQVNNYDDGRNLVTGYTNGLRSSSNMSDEDDVFVWTTIEKTFLSDGNNLDQQINTYDDGRVLVTDFVGGDKSSHTMTDVNDAYNWESYTDLFYDDNFVFSDTRVERTQIYDDGRELVIDFIGGIRSKSIMTDIGDVYGWANYTIVYDAEGNRLSRTMVYDDGHEVFTSYADGLLLG